MSIAAVKPDRNDGAMDDALTRKEDVRHTTAPQEVKD
jgi:hypothetical protein